MLQLPFQLHRRSLTPVIAPALTRIDQPKRRNSEKLQKFWPEPGCRNSSCTHPESFLPLAHVELQLPALLAVAA
jgi:hypothetical protein